MSALRISGEVARPISLSWTELAALDGAYQIADVSQLDPKRRGTAVKLAGLLNLVRPLPEAQWLGLHSQADDFHASIPLAAVRDRAILLYAIDGAPLPATSGGPFRFFIPDFAACHTHEIDECANVKFVDHLEFTRQRGFDNRPHDAQQHAALHEKT